jgi:hypothetical protein
MDVAVSTLKAHFSEWVNRARAGEEILVTDAGQHADTHAIGGADAVHLASTLAIGLEDLVVAAWDQRSRPGCALCRPPWCSVLTDTLQSWRIEGAEEHTGGS